MTEPAKPFACTISDCGMTFTNEDHLHVHTKKHDMVLQLGLEQKAAFVADQTPTPTRFIRNCEEVGLFQDLQNVSANPFDEGFKRAMETKAGILSLESTITPPSDDVLHTPQMVFPLLDNGEPTLFNTQRNITISRSSSDESGTIKEFETRTISKLTNEVTISRIVNTDDVTIKHTDVQTDVETVSYKNNVIRIESNIIRKDVDNSKVPVLVYTGSVKEITKDSITDNNKLGADKQPIMSQKSIDLVVDNLTSELGTNAIPANHDNNDKTNHNVIFDLDKLSEEQMAKIYPITKNTPKRNVQPRILHKHIKTEVDEHKNDLKTQDYEVLIKLPTGKLVRMQPVKETDPKSVLRERITKKTTVKPPVIIKRVVKKPIANVVKITSGTLIPVTLVNQQGTPLTHSDLDKVPITKINDISEMANSKDFLKEKSFKVKLPKRTVPKVPIPKINTKQNNNVGDCVYRIDGGKKTIPINVNNQITSEIVNTETLSNIKVSEPFKIGNENSQNGDTTCITEADVCNRIKVRENAENLENIIEDDDDCVVVEDTSQNPDSGKRQRIELERRSAASKRYRERLKSAMNKQSKENKQLREANQRLIAEKAVLKLLITEHMKQCPNASEIANRLCLLTNGGNL